MFKNERKDIVYNVFIKDRIKSLHIWGRQKDGSWKILYDLGMLNYPEIK